MVARLGRTSFSKRVIAVALVVSAGAFFSLIFIQRNCANSAAIIIRDASVSPGYVLVSPYIGDTFYDAPGKVELMGMNGHIAHEWRTQYQTLYAILQENGNLFVTMTPPINQSSYPSGGTTGEIEELDWKGNVLWHYEDSEMTHDFDVLPDGNIAYTRWEQAPASFAQNVVGGMQGKDSDVWTDGIVVVNRDKQVVWKWHMYDHLDPRQYPLGSLTPHSDWAHTNSIRYVADNPITHTPAFLISARDISTLFMIDAQNGSVIWQSPKNMFSLQHDATLLANGDVMVFDNGLFRPQGRPYLWSRVVELDPRTNAIVWEYYGGATGAEQAQFAVSIMGGAQRLPNGNTFITLSTEDKMLEVTPDKRVVWEYFDDSRTADGHQPIVFKARKYMPEGTAWSGRIDMSAKMLGLACGG